ncbi:MAG: glycosyltransferase [Rhodocyclaceae bacterium]
MHGQTARRRIGLLIDSLIGGGAERVVLNLAQAFQQQGHEVHVILVRNEIQHSLPAGIRVHALSEDGHPLRNKWLNRLLLAWRLDRLVARIEQGGRPFDFFVSNAEDADRISRLAGLPHVYIRYRNSMAEYLQSKIGHRTGLKRLWHSLKWHHHFRAIYGNRHIVTVSDAMQDDIVRRAGVVPRSMRTIYNPFDFEAIRAMGEAFVPDLAQPYIVYVARFSKRKRQDVLLHAFAQSAAARTHKLVLIGDAYTDSEKHWLAQTQELIATLGLTDRVVLPGFQQNPYPWIRHADLFAMSSDSEGLPTVLIEALILGTPVVSTDCPTGPSEILTGTLAPWLCQRDDPVALAGLLDKALQAYPPIVEATLARFSARHAAAQYLRHCCAPDRHSPRAERERLLRRSAWWAG